MIDDESAKENDERDAWRVLHSFAASSGCVVFPTDEIPEEGILKMTPAVRVQLADAGARAAIGLLQRGAVAEAQKYCKAALLHNPDCQAARACELALLRQTGKRSHLDDIKETTTGARDPFTVALSYTISAEPIAEQVDDRNRTSVTREHGVTGYTLLAGYFYWQAAKKYPMFSEPLTNLAACLSDLGAAIGSEEMLTHAVAINPNDPHAWYNQGLAAWKEGRLSDALAYMRRADGVGHPLAKDIIPRIEHQVMQTEEASEQQSLGADALGRGIALYSLGRYESALAEFLRGDRGPVDARVPFYAGQCFRRLGRYDEAARMFESGQVFDPLLSKLWAAVCYKNTGRLESAEAAARELVRLDPKLVDAWYVLADTYRLQGCDGQEAEAVHSLFMIDRLTDRPGGSTAKDASSSSERTRSDSPS